MTSIWYRTVAAYALLTLGASVSAQTESTGMQTLYGDHTPPQDARQDMTARIQWDAGDEQDILEITVTAPPASVALTEGTNQIGIHVDVYRDLTGNGHSWAQADDGTYATRAQITSYGAAAVRAQVRHSLPTESTITVFDSEGRAIRSVNGRDTEVTEWLASVDGAQMRLAIEGLSQGALDSAEAELTRISHEYPERVWQKRESRQSGQDGDIVLKSSGITGDCHVDVECATTSHARNVRDAVARIAFEKNNTRYGCTGTLINSGTQGSTGVEPEPYFLTANHCVHDAAAAATVEARWFYRATTCGGAVIDSRTTATRGGAQLVATSVGSDWTLLKLNEPPPQGASYAGWVTTRDVEDLPSPEGFVVHHTGGRTAQIMQGTVRASRFAFSADTSIRTEGFTIRQVFGWTNNGVSGSGMFSGDRLIGVGVIGRRGGDYCDGLSGPKMSEIYPHIEEFLTPTPRKRTYVISALPGHTAATQGFVRVHNNEDKAIEVDVIAYDDAGERYEGTTVRLSAGRATGFNTWHLENGDPRRPGGFPGVGNGQGFWRLHVTTAHDINFLGYARVAGGFVTSLNERVINVAAKGETPRYEVHLFNPGSNRSSRSLLRLVNTRNEPLTVSIDALDALARPGEETLTLDIEARQSVNLDSLDMERGNDELFEGRLGDGAGKWRLSVRAPKTLHVMSLIHAAATGEFSNVSR